MKFTLPKDILQYVASVCAELGEVTASPSRSMIVARDASNTRHASYVIPGDGGDGEDVSLVAGGVLKAARRVKDTAAISVTPDRLILETGNTVYRLRVWNAVGCADEPKVDGTGTISMRAGELRDIMEDIQAGGATTAVIAADNGTARFSGQGGSADCWITTPDAKAVGMGYVNLDLALLIPCIPRVRDWTANITLAPRGPAAMKFGDAVTYYQGVRRV